LGKLSGRGKRKEERGKRKEERGKRKEERGKRKEERIIYSGFLPSTLF
jgi:hypothetical protein